MKCDFCESKESCRVFMTPKDIYVLCEKCIKDLDDKNL